MKVLKCFQTPVILTIVAIGLSFFIQSCSKESIDMVDCTGLTPTYTSEVKAILDASCAKSGCHDAPTAQNGVNLSTYSSASAISKQDRFLGVIQHKKGYPEMPFGGPKLPEATIEILTCWVQNGSPE
jgi:hypothetical protein